MKVVIMRLVSSSIPVLSKQNIFFVRSKSIYPWEFCLSCITGRRCVFNLGRPPLIYFCWFSQSTVWTFGFWYADFHLFWRLRLDLLCYEYWNTCFLVALCYLIVQTNKLARSDQAASNYFIFLIIYYFAFVTVGIDFYKFLDGFCNSFLFFVSLCSNDAPISRPTNFVRFVTWNSKTKK